MPTGNDTPKIPFALCRHIVMMAMLFHVHRMAGQSPRLSFSVKWLYLKWLQFYNIYILTYSWITFQQKLFTIHRQSGAADNIKTIYNYIAVVIKITYHGITVQ